MAVLILINVVLAFLVAGVLRQGNSGLQSAIRAVSMAIPRQRLKVRENDGGRWLADAETEQGTVAIRLARADGSRPPRIELRLDARGDGPKLLTARTTDFDTQPPHGDRELHQRAEVDAHLTWIFARLHGEARDAALRLVNSGWRVRLVEYGDRALVAEHDGFVGDVTSPMADLGVLCALEPGPGDDPLPLIERVQHERRTSVRVACLSFLLSRQADRPEVEEALQAARGDHDEPIRRLALRVLIDRGESIDHDEAVLLLSSHDDIDRYLGLKALDASKPLPMAALVTCLRFGESGVALDASRILAASGERSALQALDKALQRSDLLPTVRSQIAAAREALFQALGGDTRAGGLALADEQEPQLALADGALGQVTIVKKPQ